MELRHLSVDLARMVQKFTRYYKDWPVYKPGIKRENTLP